MRGDRLNGKLGDLHRSDADHPRHRQALQTDLLNRYRQIHPRDRRWLMLLNPWNKTARLAVVGLAFMLLAVGACTTETTTEIEAGQQAHIALKLIDTLAEKSGEKSGDLDARLREITDFISQQDGVEELNVSVNEWIDDQAVVTTDLGLMIWGQGLDAGALQAALLERFPELADAQISFEPLSTTITESLLDRMGRQFFSIETEGASPEEIRAQILQQLAEQGFTGDAQVEVIEGDGTQEIKIILEEEVTE
jgi:hypothetical protein